MKAVVFTKYGSPDVLRLEEMEKPVPGDNEVLIKVYAASVNDWDLSLLRGKPFVNRLLFGLLKPKINIIGCDVAGRVDAVGKNVSQFKTGDEVFGDLSESGFGAFAEYVSARENVLVLKPASMTFEEAASIPQAAMLAVQGLLDKGHLRPGQKILINGAGGGVGTFAVQIARTQGVELTGVDNTGKQEMMSSIGFDHVIDYTREDFTKSGKCYDLILDVKMNRPIFAYTRVLCPNGIYVIVGGSMNWVLQALFLGPFISMFIKKKIQIVALKPNKDLGYIKELFEAGKLRPIIDGPYNLDEVPEVLRYFGEGRHKGKIVITMKPNI